VVAIFAMNWDWDLFATTFLAVKNKDQGGDGGK
jgi:hypothetical protein